MSRPDYRDFVKIEIRRPKLNGRRITVRCWFNVHQQIYIDLTGADAAWFLKTIIGDIENGNDNLLDTGVSGDNVVNAQRS